MCGNLDLGTHLLSSDIFISLNVVRLLSIVGLLLVFASSIVVMVDDIEAVNAFVSDRQNPALANSTTVELTADCDYITYV